MIQTYVGAAKDLAIIQRASKVRSANGLIVHVFGKIAAAVSLWVNFNY